MPVTLPAHAAAILPLLRWSPRWTAPVALVAGACAPDVAYLIALGAHESHSPLGILLFNLPAGLVLWCWLELLVLPTLSRVLPPIGRLVPGRLLTPRGLPRSARGWAVGCASVVLGAATHVLWDGFTHRAMWPARLLYPEVFLPMAGRPLPLARVLQHLSSLAGSLAVLSYLARRYGRLPAVPPGTWRTFLPLLALCLAGAAVGLAWRLAHPRAMGALEAQLWLHFWPTAAGGLAGLTLACAAWRLWPRACA